MSQNDKLVQVMEKVCGRIEYLLKNKPQILIAVDGRCAAGKTTFAQALAKELACNVVHMDDFFLRPEQRTKERMEKPGENVDHERFLEEVLIPYGERKTIVYRPYDCHTCSFKEAVKIEAGRVLIVEGSYACHEALGPWYDLKIFADIQLELQMQRILARNGIQAACNFKNMWIPLEEAYFVSGQVEKQCDIVLESDTDGFVIQTF